MEEYKPFFSSITLNKSNNAMILNSFLLSSQINTKGNCDILNRIEFLCILRVSSKYMVTIKEKAIFHF